jgi:hypothetical protein
VQRKENSPQISQKLSLTKNLQLETQNSSLYALGASAAGVGVACGGAGAA